MQSDTVTSVLKAVDHVRLLVAEQMNHNIQFGSDDNNKTTASFSSECV